MSESKLILQKCKLWRVEVPIGMGDFETCYFETQEKALLAKEDWKKYNFDLRIEETDGYLGEDGKYYRIKCVIN